MQYLILLSLTLLIQSCAFISNDKEDSNKSSSSTQAINPLDDFDGDFISNKDERAYGTNPYIADMPNLNINFIQDYIIEVSYENIGDGSGGIFYINPTVDNDDPTFKYRVGSKLIRDISYKNAASVGKFSSHSWGDFKNENIFWTSYPKISNSLHSNYVLKYKKYFNDENYKITDIKIYIQSSVKLDRNPVYQQINDLELSFYYYSYKNESYELLDNIKINKHFNQGSFEQFELTINNPPLELITENYFKRGEFLFSKLNDYKVNNTTYKNLYKSVRDNTVPVVFNTPLESKTYFVATKENKSKFSDILREIFDEKFKVQDNKLIKAQQFETNLPNFTYLNELKEFDKKGKWFVFTNKLKSHYLEHDFDTNDLISLSYITGSELAEQESEKVTSYQEAISTPHGALYLLGNITPNSKVSFQIEPKRLWGQRLEHWKDEIHHKHFDCWHAFNLFHKLDTELKFNKKLNKRFKYINLHINDEVFNLKKLIDEKLASASLIQNNVHIDISSISKISKINNFEENTLALEFKSFSKKTFNGVKLLKHKGRYRGYCFGGTANICAKQKWPLSVESKDFKEWKSNVNWEKVKKGHNKTYEQHFSVNLSSKITNFYN